MESTRTFRREEHGLFGKCLLGGIICRCSSLLAVKSFKAVGKAKGCMVMVSLLPPACLQPCALLKSCDSPDGEEKVDLEERTMIKEDPR